MKTAPMPTPDLVRATVIRFADENKVLERTLRKLFQLYRRNRDTSQVLLKVVAVNTLYRTNIYDVLTVAKHIAEEIPNIDSLIQSGSSEAVEKIARVQLRTKSIRFFSFATKYCSWHCHDKFPIFDY